jgi:hypothetical protein
MDQRRSIFLQLQLIFAAAAMITTSVASAENLGDIELSSFLLEPSFTLSDTHKGSFVVGNSYLEATWTRDVTLSASLKIGSLDLLGRPARYNLTSAQNFGLVEGYAQVNSIYGRLRAGLVPIPFGLEGGDTEDRLRFPRSQLFQQRIVNLRDYGVQYHIANEGFFSDWVAHNGEGGEDRDNEIWFTARWGYQGGRWIRAGMSGTTGRTSALATAPPTGGVASALTDIDPSQPAKIRIANVFFDWELGDLFIEGEGTYGAVIQDTERKMRAWHIDAETKLGESASVLVRYDSFDPRTDQGNDAAVEASLGFAWKSRYENSVLYLFVTRRDAEAATDPEHRFLLQWRMTPSANAVRALL